MGLFSGAASNLGEGISRNSDDLAKAADATRVATQNAAGLQSHNETRQANGQQPLPATNVWTQSWSRLGDSVSGDPLPMTTPIGALQSIASQGSDAFSSTSPQAYSNAVDQQWSQITSDFGKVFTAPKPGTSTAAAALGTVGNIFSLFTSIEQMVTMWVGMIPFPAFPALRIFDIATAIPPRTGPILPIPFLSGANTVLINMMPAGRCGDMGMSVGIAPPWVTIFEVFFGSSNVWIEGARAGRLLVDFTDHMKAGWGPCITGSPNVLVGGFPLPSLLNIAMGAAFAKAFQKLGKVAKKLGRGADDAAKSVDNVASKVDNAADNIDDAAKAADDVGGPTKAADDTPTQCSSEGCPVRTITGECFDEFTDAFLSADQDPVFAWNRFYNSSHHQNQSRIGNGFRHTLDCDLIKRGRRWIYIDTRGDEHEFLVREPSRQAVFSHGHVMQRIDSQIVQIAKSGEATRQFHLPVGQRTGRLMSLISDSGKLSIQYDSMNRIGRATIGPTTTKFEYDGGGRLTGVLQTHDQTSPTRLCSYQYDEAGNLIAAVDHRDGKWRYTYHADNRINAIVDPTGYGFYHSYDPWGRVTHTWGDDGLYDLALEYSPIERKTTVRFADGVVKSYHYDNSHRVSYVIDGCEGVTTYARDDNGKVTAEISPAGEMLEYLYDSVGRLYAVKDPLGYLHDPETPSTQRRNPLTYQLPDRPAQWIWGSVLPPIETDDIAADDTVLDDWDASVRNRVAQVFDRDRTAEGSGTSVADRATAPPASGLDFDEIPEADGRTANEVERDSAGNLIAVRDADGRSQVFSQTRWRSRGSDARGDGGITRYEYNLREQVSRIIDPRGSVHEYQRDGLDRITEIRQDGESLAKYIYDSAGNVQCKVDAQGKIAFEWKRGLGGVGVERTLSPELVEAFENDDEGRIVAANSAVADCKFAYGAFAARPIADLRGGLGIEHQTDESGNLTTVVLGDYQIAARSEGNVTRITDPTGSVHEVVSGLAGLMSLSTGDGLKVLSQFDSLGRLTQSVVRGGGGGLWQREYGFTPGGKLEQILDSQSGESRLSYDLNGRIQTVHSAGSVERYDWDLADNLISSPFMKDAEIAKCNRLDRADGHAFQYDVSGRLSEHQSPDVTRRFQYDSLDRLIQCSVEDKVWRGQYDPLCRIVQSEFDGVIVENYWDDFRLAARKWSDGRVRVFVYADLSALVPFMFVDYAGEDAGPASGARFYLTSDQTGMPIRVHDASGQTVWSARRSAFGHLDIDPESTIKLDLRFPGHLYDAAIGVHHNRFRTYDPKLGRYLQIDPIGVVGGVNTYAYCPDPFEGVDIDGHGKKCGGGGKDSGTNGVGDGTPGSNLPSKGSKRGRQLAALKRRIRNMGPGNTSVKGTNRSLAQVTTSEADELGKAFVGEGYRVNSRGMYISKDGTKLYRPPTAKPNSPFTNTGKQANFVKRVKDPETGKWRNADNAHIDITD